MSSVARLPAIIRRKPAPVAPTVRKRAAADDLAAGTSDTPALFLECTTPPSVNETLINGGRGKRGRTAARKYDEWKRRAMWELSAQKIHAFKCPVLVFVAVDRMNDRADIDNRLKPLLDILKRVGVYRDDSLVTGVAAAWAATQSVKTRVAIVPAVSVRAIFQPTDAIGATGGWFLEPLNENGAP